MAKLPLLIAEEGSCRSPPFMMTKKFFAGSSMSLMLSIGLPSTSRRSASAPSSTAPSLPGYGFRSPDRPSNSAFVDVAMISASAGLYQRVRLTSMAPCRSASACENRTSVPNAVLIRIFLPRHGLFQCRKRLGASCPALRARDRLRPPRRGRVACSTKSLFRP